MDVDVRARMDEPDTRPAQSIDEWTRVYEGLSEEEIDAVDRISKTRSNLTRHLP
jgi:hypothetical protein